MNGGINSFTTGFRNPPSLGHCQIVCNHFTFVLCKGTRHQNLNDIKSTKKRKTKYGSMDPYWAHIRKIREVEWIK